MKENTKWWLPNDSHTFGGGHGLPQTLGLGVARGHPKRVVADSPEGVFY
jgi:hypothetical protein